MEQLLSLYSFKSRYSFLFESAASSETIGRYSFVGASKFVRAFQILMHAD